MDRAVDGQHPFLSMYGRTISRSGSWARGLESALKKWTKSDETRRKARNVTETKISRVLKISPSVRIRTQVITDSTNLYPMHRVSTNSYPIVSTNSYPNTPRSVRIRTRDIMVSTNSYPRFHHWYEFVPKVVWRNDLKFERNITISMWRWYKFNGSIRMSPRTYEFLRRYVPDPICSRIHHKFRITMTMAAASSLLLHGWHYNVTRQIIIVYIYMTTTSLLGLVWLFELASWWLFY